MNNRQIKESPSPVFEGLMILILIVLFGLCVYWINVLFAL